jgi:peptide/nickel transport system substrate-binding protein
MYWDLLVLGVVMTQPFDRRSFLAGGLALGAGAVVLGSGSEWAGASATNGRGRNGVSKATPKRGGSIVFGIDTEEGGFDPTTARWDEGGYLYGRTVFDPLTTVTATGGWEPYLAQSITPNADFTSYVITLRPNIVFHDGTALDSNALHLNLTKQKASALTGAVIQNVTAITVSGPLSVTVTLDSPWEQFPYYLSSQSQVGYIAAPSMLNNPNGTSHPVGTGPFVYKEWIPNTHFIATANPHYWRKGLPYLSQITFKPIITPDSRVAALETGTIDIMHTVTPSSIKTFRGNKKWSYFDNSGSILGQGSVNCLMLNTSKPPFNNKTLRTAMAMATDSAQYSKIIDLGVNAPLAGMYQPGSPYYSKTAYPKPNPKQAAKLVAQVAKQTGQPVAFTLNATNDPIVERAAQYLQQAYSQAGMKVSIDITSQAALINTALAGTYQAVTWRQFGAVIPDLNYVWWSTTTAGPPLPLNMARNSDTRIQQALLAGRHASTKAVQVKAYREVNQYLSEDIPYIYLDRSTWAVVANPKVQNFVNPTTPKGTKAYGFDQGVVWPTEIWVS